MTTIQMDSFQRPAPYWLRRAEKCKQAGDLRRAAVLERHAARTDPGYAAGPASYALTLRQLQQLRLRLQLPELLRILRILLRKP